MAKQKPMMVHAGASKKYFEWPTNADLRALPLNVVIPKEIMILLGELADFITFNKNNQTSFTAMSMAAPMITFVNTWAEIHFMVPRRDFKKLLSLRNYLESHFKISGKSYEWSGIIEQSTIKGCNCRLAIGPRSKLYGHTDIAYSVGSIFKTNIYVPC